MYSLSIISAAILVLTSSVGYSAESTRAASKKSVKILTESTPKKPKALQEESDTVPSPEVPPQISEPQPAPAIANVRKWTVGYDLSPIGLILPFKKGPSVSYRHDETWTFEASYFGGSLSFPLIKFFDLGSASEYHWLVNARRFGGGSFNWVFGLGRHSYEVRLGNAILSRLTSSSIPTDALTVHLLEAQFGLGNQWVWENGFLFGVDWLVVEVPLSILKAEAPALEFVTNTGDRETINDALSILKSIPTGALFKVRLGYSF